MEENLEELAEEEFNADYEEIYKNSTLEDLENELYNTQEAHERRELDGIYITVSGEHVIPGTRKIAELEKMIKERTETPEEDSEEEIPMEETEEPVEEAEEPVEEEEPEEVEEEEDESPEEE